RLGLDHLRALCDPFVLGHRLVTDDVVANRLIYLLNVAPFACEPVLKPEHDTGRIACDRLLIQALDNPPMACVFARPRRSRLSEDEGTSAGRHPRLRRWEQLRRNQA